MGGISQPVQSMLGRRGLAGVGGVAVLVWAGLLAAQLPQAQKPLQVRVNLVHLFVTVRDRHGGLVTNLTRENFRVYEDGNPQEIAYFDREMNLPLTLALLVDTSGSQERLLEPEKRAAKRFLARVLRRGDEALVITFDLDVNLLADFTFDLERLNRAIDRAQINAPSVPVMVQGPVPARPNGTHFYDAVYLACTEKLAGEAGRKAIVALTDAQDYGSMKKLSDAIEAAQHSDTVVHIVLLADRWQYWGSYEGDRVASRLAEETGGRVIQARNAQQLDRAFDELAQELRSQYVLGYYPTNTARDGGFRRIRVEVTPGGYRALTRKGYYAPRADAPAGQL